MAANTGTEFPGFGEVSLPESMLSIPNSDTPNFLTVLSRVVLSCMVSDGSVRFIRTGNDSATRWYAILASGQVMAILPSRGRGYGNDVEGVNCKRADINPRDYAEIHGHCYALDRIIKSDGDKGIAVGYTLEKYTEKAVDSWARSLILQHIGGVISTPPAAPTRGESNQPTATATVDIDSKVAAAVESAVTPLLARLEAMLGATQPAPTTTQPTQPATQPAPTTARQTRPRAASRK